MIKRLLAGAAALALIAALGACSSSSKHATASGGTAGSTAAKGAPIKVGEICSCSGEPGFSQYEVPLQDSVKAWADSVNATGGIDGHPVQVIAEDDATNPGTSVTEAQTLISDHVVAIIDDTTLVTAWASAVEAAHIPVVGTDSINPPFDTSPDFYAEGQTNATTPQAMVAIAKQAGAKTLGLAYCAEAPVCAQSVPLVQAAAKAGGMREAYTASISATAPSYTAQCLAAKQAGVDALFIADVGLVLVNFANDCARQGYHPVYLSEAAGLTISQTSTPSLSTLWTQYADYPFWGTTPAVQQYNAAMDRYFPGVRENNQIMTEDAFMGWISARLVQAGIQASHLSAGAAPSAAEVTRGLDSLKNETLGGLAPPLTFVAGQPHHVSCYFVGRIQGGKPALVGNGQPSCIRSS